MSARATAVEAAKHIFLSRTAFNKLLRDGVIPRSQWYDLDDVRKRGFAHSRAAAAGRGGPDGGAVLAVERAKLARAQTEAAELKNAITRGELVPLDLVAAKVIEMIVSCREVALGMPGKIADELKPHTPKDREGIFELVDREVREMLDGLSVVEIRSVTQGR